MIDYRRWVVGWWLLAAAMAHAQAPQPAGTELQAFRFVEYLEHNWQGELVTFPLAVAVTDAVLAEAHLEAPDGSVVAHQLVVTAEGRHLAFLADLPAGEERAYRLLAGRRHTPPGQLTVEESAERIRLVNGQIGVELRQHLADGEGPIAAVRLRSGAWIGGSALQSDRELTAYEAKVTAVGPVFAAVQVKASFAGGGEWQLRLHMIDGDPVIVVDEACDVPGASRWELDVTPGFAPSHGIFRTGWYRPDVWPTHTLFARPLAEGNRPPFVLLPWINWSDGHQVSSFSLYREAPEVRFWHDKEERHLVRQFPASAPAGAATEGLDRDVLFLAAGEAGIWARPGIDWGPDRGVPLKMEDDRAVLHFPLAGPARHWLLGVSTLAETVVPDRDLTAAETYAIKHCGTSLQQVLGMTLVWGDADAEAQYPRLGERREGAVTRQAAVNALNGVQPARVFLNFIQWWDAQNGQHLRRHDDKVWTHTITRSGFLPVVDDALGSGALTADEFVRLRARLAFMAYKMASPDFYSHERGWRANPNMTTMRYSLVGLLGCVLADHPESTAWYTMGSGEVLRQLEEWVGPNGGWLESPHYQSLLGNGVMLLWAAHRNGLSDDVFHPNLLKTILYLAKISTPPDPRFGGLRHLPPAGNTYRFETSGFSGILAKLHRERQPEVAAELQWMWLQHGKPMWTGIGGGSDIASVMGLLVDGSWEEVSPPAWGSEVFPYSGTMLRAHFAGDRETQMYMLHGKFNQHYDQDRGSFELWGKGQPLSLDWGYVQPYTPDMHNMLDSGQGVGEVAAFSTAAAADYLQVDLGPWQRRVLFVKDVDPDGPSFFVVRDDSAVDGSWHQWFYTDALLALDGEVVRMTGRGDVDLDLWLAGKRAAEFDRLSPAEAAAALVRPPTVDDAVVAGVGALPQLEEEALTLMLRSRDEVKSCPEGVLGSGSNVIRPLAQRGLSLPVGEGRPVFAVLFPRLQGTASPDFTELAEGRGVKVVSPQGVDYVFLGPAPFAFADEAVSFKGVAGAIRVRGTQITLTLGSAGEIRHGSHELVAGEAATAVY